MKMTKEQEVIAENNLSLVNGFLNHKRLNDDEWRSTIYEAYLTAIVNHDETRGTLSTLFYSIATNKWIRESVKRDRYREHNALGYKDSIELEYNKEPHITDTYFKGELFDVDLDLDSLNERELEICRQIVENNSITEIAENLNVSRMTIYRDIDKIKSKIR